MKIKIFPFVIFILYLYLISGCISSKNISGPITDEIRDENFSSEVQLWEDGLRTNPEGNSFEWWYFDASFTDGSTAVIVFSTKSILNPGGNADPNVSMVLTTPEGIKISVDNSPGIEKFYASESILDIKIGESYVKGDLAQCFIHFEKDGIKADLTFLSKAPAWRPGSGKMYFDLEKEKYFAWLPAIPFGDVEGILSYNGEEIQVTGTGYHDHNWGNVRLDKVMTQWYWGRAKIDEYTLIFSQMLTSPKYGSSKVPVFYLAKGNEILSSSEFELTFTPSDWLQHKGGRDYPEKIVVNMIQEKMQTTIQITDPVFLETRDLLKGLPWPAKSIFGLVTNPYYFRFDANFNLKISDSTETIEKTGKGIFEMMLLRGMQTVRD